VQSLITSDEEGRAFYTSSPHYTDSMVDSMVAWAIGARLWQAGRVSRLYMGACVCESAYGSVVWG
jgi:hypothetical protein